MHLPRTCPVATTSLVLLMLLCSSLARAQATPLAEALRDCLALTDNLARLTCYDDLARQQALPAAITAVPAAPAPAAEPARTPVATFGQPAARVEPDQEGTAVLVDTVVAARQVEPTKWLLTLQSGQVWRQTIGKSYLIRPGDSVRISPTSWGSDFRLSVEGRRGYIQVTRQE